MRRWSGALCEEINLLGIDRPGLPKLILEVAYRAEWEPDTWEGPGGTEVEVISEKVILDNGDGKRIDLSEEFEEGRTAGAAVRLPMLEMVAMAFNRLQDRAVNGEGAD